MRQGDVIILVPDTTKIQKVEIKNAGFVPDHPDPSELRLNTVQAP
jgi:hypothetical protein